MLTWQQAHEQLLVFRSHGLELELDIHRARQLVSLKQGNDQRVEGDEPRRLGGRRLFLDRRFALRSEHGADPQELHCRDRAADQHEQEDDGDDELLHRWTDVPGLSGIVG